MHLLSKSPKFCPLPLDLIMAVVQDTIRLLPRSLPGSGRLLAAQESDPAFTLLSSLKGRGNLYSLCQSLALVSKPQIVAPCLLITVQTPLGALLRGQDRGRKRHLVVKKSLEMFLPNSLYLFCRA